MEIKLNASLIAIEFLKKLSVGGRYVGFHARIGINTAERRDEFTRDVRAGYQAVYANVQELCVRGGDPARVNALCALFWASRAATVTRVVKGRIRHLSIFAVFAPHGNSLPWRRVGEFDITLSPFAYSGDGQAFGIRLDDYALSCASLGLACWEYANQKSVALDDELADLSKYGGLKESISRTMNAGLAHKSFIAQQRLKEKSGWKEGYSSFTYFMAADNMVRETVENALNKHRTIEKRYVSRPRDITSYYRRVRRICQRYNRDDVQMVEIIGFLDTETVDIGTFTYTPGNFWCSRLARLCKMSDPLDRTMLDFRSLRVAVHPGVNADGLLEEIGVASRRNDVDRIITLLDLAGVTTHERQRVLTAHENRFFWELQMASIDSFTAGPRHFAIDNRYLMNIVETVPMPRDYHVKRAKLIGAAWYTATLSPARLRTTL